MVTLQRCIFSIFKPTPHIVKPFEIIYHFPKKDFTNFGPHDKCINMSNRLHNSTNRHLYRRWAKASRSTRAKLLVCHPEDTFQVDTVQEIRDSVTVGRGAENGISFGDATLSGTHFRIFETKEEHYIVDLQSKSGTALNGYFISRKRRLRDNDVIRAGNCLFVYRTSAPCTQIHPNHRHGVAGDFHAGDILLNLRRAALSPLHLLLMGPPGSGKDHAAQTVASYLNTDVRYTDCSTTSPENILAEIQETTEKLLYLDNADRLPMSCQYSLAQFLGDGKYSSGNKSVRGQSSPRFIFSVTEPGSGQGLALGLKRKLRVVKLPSLRERAADIPSIFRYLIHKYMSQLNLQPEFILSSISTSHYESLCIDGFQKDNIHGLVEIAQNIATDVAIGINATETLELNLERRASFRRIAKRFQENSIRDQRANAETAKSDLQLPSKPATKTVPAVKKTNYEAARGIIEEAYYESGGNISKTKRVLESQGYRIDRWTLNKYIKRIWSLPIKKDCGDQDVG